MRRDLSRLSPLSSYSYTIHTVSPPRPLIPVSRGGVQTGKQTGGRVASLFIRCLTRWAWQSISHLQNFSNGIGMRLRNSGLYLQVGTPIHTIMCKCMCSKMQTGARTGFHTWLCRCCETGLRVRTGTVPQILTLHPNFHLFWMNGGKQVCIFILHIKAILFQKSFILLNVYKTQEGAGLECLQTHLQFMKNSV